MHSTMAVYTILHAPETHEGTDEGTHQESAKGGIAESSQPS